MKSDKMSYIIFANIKSLIKKIDECANNPEKSSRTKLGKIFLVDIQCQLYLILTIQKTSILYIVRDIVWKRFVLF